MPHSRYTRSGTKKLEDPRDIYELVANNGARRLRACILASIPGDVTEAAMQQADVTLKSKADTSPGAMQKMVAAFAEFGVQREHIEKRIQRRIDAITPAQVVSLKRIYVSLRDDMSTAADWFEIDAGEGAAPPPAAPKAPPAMSVEQFAANESAWMSLVQSGKKTADALIGMLSTKNTLSDEQKAAIRKFEDFSGAEDQGATQ